MDGPGPFPPRGWYPDPGGTPAWRWWDGMAWSEHLRPYGAPSPSVDRAALDAERRSASLVERYALPLLIIAVLLSAVIQAFEASYLTSLFHWFRHIYDLARSGQSINNLPPQPNPPGKVSLFSTFVVDPAFLAAFILILIFQHRAATIARRLGLNARLKPTFGVVSWFIPFANLVLPCLAWLDMLPSGHPQRSTIKAVWFSAIAYQLLKVASVLALFSSTGLSQVLSIGALVFAGLCATRAPSALRAITSEHAAAVDSAGDSGHGSSSGI